MLDEGYLVFWSVYGMIGNCRSMYIAVLAFWDKSSCFFALAIREGNPTPSMALPDVS